MVTHDIGAVRKYCDRAILLRNGNIIKYGDIDKVCDEYVEKNISEKAKLLLKEQDKLKKEEEERKRKIKEEAAKTKGAQPVKREVVIERVKILNKKNKEIEFVRRGDAIVVKSKIRINKLDKKYFVAVQAIDATSDIVLSGNNMKIDGVNYKWKFGINNINIKLENTSFNRGDIYFKVFVLEEGKNDNKIVAKYSGKKCDRIIKIIPQDGRAGIIYMEHNWFFK